MFLLVICEILGLFVITLTVDDKYFLCYRESLPQPIQIQASQKGKNFSELVPEFPKFSSKFQPLEKIIP